MDCYWCSRSFREHVIHEAATSCRFCMYWSGYSFLGLMGCVYLILWTRDAVYVCSIFFMLCWHLELDACIHNIDVCTSTSAVCVLFSRRFWYVVSWCGWSFSVQLARCFVPGSIIECFHS
jgi:presenilin-like A22 family membrane protease